MIDKHTVLGLIVARGGSKGLPRKNIRAVGGKPLIAWTIEQAKASCLIDRLILSSDDAEIIAVAKAFGCDAPFVRPAQLANDTASSLAVVRHALAEISGDFSYLVLLQPTSPLRTAQDIDGSIRLCDAKGASTCVSVCEVEKTPYWMFRVDDNLRLTPLFPPEQIPESRQSAPSVYLLNGAVYVARCDHLRSGGGFIAADTVAWLMPKWRSADVDTETDLGTVENSLAARA